MFMVTQGFFVTRTNIPGWWIWSHYIGFHTYSWRIFMWNEFTNARVECDPGFCPYVKLKIEDGSRWWMLTVGFACRYPTGEAVLERYDLGTANPGEDMAVLVCMGIIYRIIFFLILQFVHKGKR